MNSVITYSPAYTIVSTYECFNRCSYCNFRVDVDEADRVSIQNIRKTLKELDANSIAEILILSGELHPA